MTPLLALLLAGVPAGVWRIERFGPIQIELVSCFGRSVQRISNLLVADKAAIMDQLASAFQFPEWFGHNWDALYDSLSERAAGDGFPDIVVVEPVTGGGDQADRNVTTLAEILADVARDTDRCFLIVGPRPDDLPPLPSSTDRR
ncbi:MAG: barstar family protein [Acidimicrobiia bacterium]|nr:barstar family protein [Acidimicrobiia bacterium]